jgi:hypothetical protein
VSDSALWGGEGRNEEIKKWSSSTPTHTYVRGDVCYSRARAMVCRIFALFGSPSRIALVGLLFPPPPSFKYFFTSPHGCHSTTILLVYAGIARDQWGGDVMCKLLRDIRLRGFE